MLIIPKVMSPQINEYRESKLWFWIFFFVI